MANFLSILFKPTSEQFEVPYELQTTIYDLMKYVCSQSTVLLNTNPNEYYLAINNSEALNKDQTVQQIGLDQPDRIVSLQMYIKTSVLMKRISQSHTQFWQDSNQPTIPIRKPNIAVEPSPSSSHQQQTLTTTESTSSDNNINNEVHILVCGSPKVGKSTLINALCGCPVAKVYSFGLDRCTQRNSYYQLDNIYFWDTPGIQEWSNLTTSLSIKLLGQDQTPLCMFYCASPGSFTKLEQLRKLIKECIQRHIFCVLVVTNMFANISRHAILNEFKALLSCNIEKNQQVKEEHGVWYYGRIGLCTMVNSQEYVDEDINRRIPQQGVNELVLALIKSFSGTHQLNGWLRTIEKNQQFWLNKQEELYKLMDKADELCLSELIENI